MLRRRPFVLNIEEGWRRSFVLALSCQLCWRRPFVLLFWRRTFVLLTEFYLLSHEVSKYSVDLEEVSTVIHCIVWNALNTEYIQAGGYSL